jgi:single-strand DNA-binding protein
MNSNIRFEKDSSAAQRSRGPSLNNVQLIGRLAADPEVRPIANGGQVGTLRIATSWQDRTEYHTLVVFGSQAKFAGDYLTKGRLVFAEGRLQARQWTAQDGTQRRTTEVIAHTLQALGPLPKRDEPAPLGVLRDETELEAER